MGAMDQVSPANYIGIYQQESNEEAGRLDAVYPYLVKMTRKR